MDVKQQLAQLKRGCAEIISEEELLAKLQQGRPLNVKLGVDPTAPDIHLGFTVVMRKLKAFQDLGHKVTLIIGDYTATVGDPSGKNKTRPLLTHEEVLENAETYKQQFFKIVNPDKTEVVYNGEWFKKLTFDQVTKLMSQITVAQMLEREDFQNRYKAGQSISLHEFLYPMMQAYDSLMIKSDVEIGGTDQKFNILRGREIQRNGGQESQVGMMMPILLGTDGKEKMSKSLGNYVGINETAQAMYHKLYSLPDALIKEYMTLLTDMPLSQVEETQKKMETGERNPNEVKHELALDIVSQYHSKEKAEAAAAEEKKIHLGQALPEDMPSINVDSGDIWVPACMVAAGLVKSNGEGRRLIQNGGVRFDDVKVTDPKANVSVNGTHILQVGKRKFAKIIAV